MIEGIHSNSVILNSLRILSFVFGAFVGSFLNVCIYRIPYRRSILYPPSHCSLCLSPLRWYHNIPVVGYISLKGRCAFCHQSFSVRYAVIEVLMGLISLSLFVRSANIYSYFVFLIFMGGITILSFIDIDHWLLPDKVTIPFAALGLLFSLFTPVTPSGHYINFRSSAIGLVTGISILYLLGFIASKVMNREALGGGDIKFMGMICAFLGWKAFLPVLLMAALQGSIYGLFQLIYLQLPRKEIPLNNNGIYSVFKDRSDLFTPTSHHIPFGPFLGLAAYEYLLWGNALIYRIFGLTL